MYVFCLLAHRELATLDRLDVAQWRFFVARRGLLDARFGVQKSIGLGPLLAPGVVEVGYGALAATVAAIARPASADFDLAQPPG